MKKIVPAPYIDQTERWVNGCESISSVMLLQAVGIAIDPDTFIARDLPHAPLLGAGRKALRPRPVAGLPRRPPRPYRLRLLCALYRQGAEQRSGARGRSRQVRSRGRERQDGGRAVQLPRRRDAGGVLGHAGLPACAREAGPLAAGRWHRLCMEVQRALSAAGGL